MHFRVAYPQDVVASGPDKHADIVRFYDALLRVIRARGHTLEVLPQSGIPAAEAGVVSLGYHGHGRQAGVWHIKKAYMHGYYYFDRDGFSGWSEMARSPEHFQAAMDMDETAALAFVQHMRSDYFGRGLSKLIQPTRLFPWDGRPYVFLPLQVMADTVMRLSRVDYAGFARAVVSAFAGSPYRVVIKRHPSCPFPEVFHLLAELAQQPHVQVSAAAIDSLLAHASAVVCINSSVGFEALFYGCPVLTAGASDYEWVTSRIADIADVNSLPQRIDAWAHDPGRVARFLAYFCQEYLLHCDDEGAMHRRLLRIEREAAQGSPLASR